MTDIRERIIAAASMRFTEEGFSSVTVGEIAAGLGISKKTLYKYFSGKEEILAVVTGRLLDGIRGEFRSIVEGDSSFLVKLEMLVTFLGMRLARFSRPLLRDIQRHSPQIWDRVQQFRRDRISTDFKGLLLRGVADGFVRRDVDIDLFLMAFLGAVEAVVNPAVLAEHPLSVQEIIRSLMSVFFRGILTAGALEEFALLQSGKSSRPVTQLPGAL
ncbi:MAG TPA: TetR/AcrR family transcriptional regulator [Bacteroidota bacterium]|nr:TetR/AcrR family transcriptional regulator [Bacteroidota bacterium]